MAAQITYNRIQSTLPGPPAQYQVQANVTGTVTIDDAVFVYRYADQVFDHIATVLDMQTYPDALNPSFPFYRQNTVTKQFSAGNQAIDFAQTIEDRLSALCNEYDIVAATFVPGTVPITVP